MRRKRADRSWSARPTLVRLLVGALLGGRCRLAGGRLRRVRRRALRRLSGVGRLLRFPLVRHVAHGCVSILASSMTPGNCAAPAPSAVHSRRCAWFARQAPRRTLNAGRAALAFRGRPAVNRRSAFSFRSGRVDHRCPTRRSGCCRSRGVFREGCDHQPGFRAPGRHPPLTTCWKHYSCRGGRCIQTGAVRFGIKYGLGDREGSQATSRLASMARWHRGRS